ncbi:hypothetical protein BLOT_012435 [Blomia tropicalis]|nr:hypothetical protein BLOT_012435 [Blomia tropicalis]
MILNNKYNLKNENVKNNESEWNRSFVRSFVRSLTVVLNANLMNPVRSLGESHESFYDCHIWT